MSRYKILQASAGEGGYGRIDKATDTELDRPVAIKTLDPLFRAGPGEDDIERFRREAKALAQLSHPSVPAIYDVQFSPEDSAFRIIFEWVEGQTLRDYIQDRGVLSLQEARDYFAHICSALSHAHDRGIVHRDIKPTNIILNRESSACYVVDFGIALRQADVSRLTGSSPIGTSGYMSPEQERGDDVGPTSDVFALGVLLYECLAGGRPAVGGYRPLGVHNEAIPPSVDQLIQESLSDDPARRPQSAKAFIDRLGAALRPHASFTSTLADGSLHEIQLALSEMESNDYSALPPGQRVLVVNRLEDLATVDEEGLRRAVAAIVTELVRLAHDSGDAYALVVQYAFEYGYEKRYAENWHGHGPTRSALNDVALICDAPSHATISRAVRVIADEDSLAARAGWYFHDLRVLLQNLLINPVCDADEANALGRALGLVNRLSH